MKSRTFLAGISYLFLVMAMRASLLWADAPGSNSFDFLKLGANARQEAMGETGVGLFDELGNPFLNPAALAGTAVPRIGFSYNRLFDDIQQGDIGYIHPTS